MKRLLTVQLEQRTDGRWRATVPSLPGVEATAETSDAALVAVHTALSEQLDRARHVERRRDTDRDSTTHSEPPPG